MNFTLCVLLVYNDNGSVQTLCTKRANARYAKCLHIPIVIINQQYTKGEIHFINNAVNRQRRQQQQLVYQGQKYTS